ncbi:hypothetical protein M1L60_29900 [Actinoplanes sp. TRM 88003]|uniref:Secreted protein n=1 Tax=Paractinoplanes aksuensis TaxID=2939490 RepID=A0ABT1DVD4_9ACTN|nr:hypothetical protein [Actinoplanes aksuensis]MCO8274818.1 hypothetical protein [Actinoplanes aksuensis]
MDRRSLLRGAAVVGAAGISGVALPEAAKAAGPAGLPTYRYLRDALTLPLRYNPTGEFIFPCIRGVYDKISGARGRYYLYYAPHEKPGGICVAWANSLNGPFTEHPGNPIIDNVLPGGGTVSHVSSPHVTWIPETRQFHLYWHGENTTTRVARSSDGINFRDETPILSTRLVPGLTETSYARVFAHSGRYVMVYMGVLAGKRRIYHGWSPNGWDQWQFSQSALVNPEPDGLTDISGPSLVTRNGTTYVAYHGNDGKMRITEVGNAFDRENHLGVFYSPAASDNGRAAAPSFGTDGGVQYMFYEAGPRLNARICIARAV